jgi:ATP-dependent HslUV protease ATP-binding subunit HslU
MNEIKELIEKVKVKGLSRQEHLTPHEIVRELDKFIIGQTNAKRSVAIALRNRWRRLNVEGAMREEIMPNNIIMIGPTGVGKTEIARRLARLAGAPFVKVEATKYTEVGYVGRDVESMVRDLADHAVNLVRSEMMKVVEEKAKDLAEERIVDILVPPIEQKGSVPSLGFMFPGMPAQTPPTENGQSEEEEKKDSVTHLRTRNRFRAKLKKGELDDREIEVEVPSVPQIASMQIMGPFGGGGFDDIAQNIGEALSNVMPKKMKTRRVTVAEARTIFSQEEAAKLIDQEALTKEAISRVENSGIIFIDEIDKVAGKGKEGGGPDVSREGVQRDLLPIVEGSTVGTKYGPVRSDHILFIASGAFHTAKPSDLIPELQGRFPIRVELDSLTENDFFEILTKPENALIKQYTALMKTEDIEIEFTEDAIRAVARIAFEVNESVENIGARRLHTILTTLLEQILFDVPDIITDKHIKITQEIVEERLAAIVRNRDLSKYIL